MKKLTAVFIAIITVVCAFSGCGGENIQLDYHESFVVQAFNEINGKIGYSKGYTLQDAKYAYVQKEQLQMESADFEGTTEYQKNFFADIYCVIEINVLMDGESKIFTRYFSISSYDLTDILEGCKCVEVLYDSLTFVRMDLSRLTRFLS